MDFRVLGPLEAHDDGRALALPKGRARALLALLILHRGEVVSTDRILDALWGERPPPTAVKAVQGHVSSLRRALSANGTHAVSDELLVTQAPGYALLTEAGAVDAARFEALASESRRAVADDAARALALVEEALALWRGPALQDFAFDDFARPEIDRLEELRLEALEDRAEALLRVGRHADAVGELEALVAEHPLRERLRGQLMIALYRAGRQADALEAYRAGRRLLADELGLEPGLELQQLERQVLEHDPALEAPGGGRPARAPAPRSEEESPRRPRAAAIAIAAIAVAVAVVAAFVAFGSSAEPIAAPPVRGVVGIDATVNEIVVGRELGTRPFAIAASDDALWVADPVDGVVSRLDPSDGRVLQTIGIGLPAVDLAVAADTIWVAGGSAGTIVRIDPEGGGIAERYDLTPVDALEVPAVNAIAAGSGDTLWAATSKGVLRLDGRTGEVARADARGVAALDIAAAGDAVWAAFVDGRTVRIERGAASQTAEFSGAEATVVSADREGAWLGTASSVLRLDPTTASVAGALDSGGLVSGIALSDGALWVAVENGALLRVDADTLEVQRAIALRSNPLDVTVAGDRVWVTVEGEREPG